MRAGAFAEQLHLFLDPVLHLTAATVYFVVKLLGIALQVRHHEARVGPLCGVFGFVDDKALAPPRFCPILEVLKQPLLFAATLEPLFGLLLQLPGVVY